MLSPQATATRLAGSSDICYSWDMAVPTISTVSPSVGPATGYTIIEITGTNFKVPSAPIAVPMVTAVPTVKVLVGTEEALAVRVLSSTLVHALAPPSRQSPRQDPPALSIVLSNLDSAGAVISGETVTKSSAYTYQPWKLGPSRKDPPLLKVSVELISRFIREITQNVSVFTHVDFGAENTGTYTILPELPSLAMKLSFPRDVEFSQWDNGWEDVDDPNDASRVLRFRGQRTHMVLANITAAAEGLREAMFLVDGVLDSVQQDPYVTVEADPDLYPGERDQYLLEVDQQPRQGNNQGNSGIVVFSLAVRVRGVRHISDYPTSVLYKMAEAYITETNMEATAPVERQVTLL